MKRIAWLRVLHLCIGLAGAVGLSSCTLVTISPYGNEPRSSSMTSTQANLDVETTGEKSDGRFVGLALSGGGSRSAIFATSVMLELQKQGILKKVDVMSSVSGGSLPAAYYALEDYKGIKFDEADALEQMKLNFQARWFGRWFLPQNIVRYWFTDFTRSDIMVQVFDSNLFHGATFANLNPERPKLLINGTDSGRFDRFIFSDEMFEELQSNLSTYSVARAVNVSSAFPGVFQRIPLENFSSQAKTKEARYRHLYDGGPTDNLGVSTLIQVLERKVCEGKGSTVHHRKQALHQKMVEKKTESPCDDQAAAVPLDRLFPQGCLVISVDATPREDDEDGHRAHSRSVTDYFIDSNFLNATDVMLLSLRREVLENAGLARPKQDRARFGQFSFDGERTNCHFWHIALRHYQGDGRAARIGTSFGLDTWEQDLLVRAGTELVQQGLAMKDVPAVLSRMTKTP
jgi:NTE family protein